MKTIMSHRQQISVASKILLVSALLAFCPLHAQAQDARPTQPAQPQAVPSTQQQGNYAAPAQAAPSRRRGVRLPPLSPRPGYIIGRAVFADGRPIPNFTVRANTQIGGNGANAVGSNGRYTMPISDPNVNLVTDITANVQLRYQGEEYILRMHPADGMPDNGSPGSFVGDAKKGIVRDFVFRLTGIAPGHPTNPPPSNVTRNDPGRARYAFEGHPIQVLSGLAYGHPTVLITLTPTGPLIDGSQGAVIQRTLPNFDGSFFEINDLPLGTYTATASEVAPDGTLKPHKLRMKVVGTPVGSGDTPLDSVPVLWPADVSRETGSEPTLTVMP